MRQYVDKEKLYQYMDNEVEWRENQDRLSSLEVVSDFEVEDVEQVVHGKVTHVTGDMPYCEYGTCNVCGAYIQAWNYCPSCGAKMDLTDD